jgi:imidazolonepropionase-like amidohydrolase
MGQILFHNGRLFDPAFEEPRDGYEVLVEDDRVREVADRPIAAADAVRIDLGGRTLMPGLIDAHVHVTATTLDLGKMAEFAPSWVTAKASHILKDMLHRGFTTVRDAGGADWGLRDAVAESLLEGPRMFISGRILTPTGGNNDYRPRTAAHIPCPCCDGGVPVGRVVDGITEIRRAARDELRKGADQVKFNASGGLAGPNGNVDTINFSAEEVRAMVEEADAWNTYAMAHAYTPRTIGRAVEAGARTIEHGNLVDEATARLMAEKGVYMVPTLSIYHTAHRYGRDLGLPAHSLAKLEGVRDAGMQAVEICKRNGVAIGHGSDLLGPLHVHQSLEFALKAEVLSPREAIIAATATNAEVLKMSGQLGTVAAGAVADLLVVDGDPTGDIGRLQNNGRHLAAILKEGRFVKNALAA